MTESQHITVNSRKYDQTIRRSWNCELVEQTESLLVLVGVFDEDVTHADLGHIKRGTVSREYYWLDCWYSIFRFHEPDGTLRNYYCNINQPPKFENGVLDYVDLDIDVLVWPDLKYKILDVKEFEENAVRYKYPESVAAKTYETLAELTILIKKRDFPFNISQNR